MTLVSRLMVGIVCTTIMIMLLVRQAAATDDLASALVYCSEASPRSFDPAIYPDGATMAASHLPIYNRLVDYEPGSTKIVPSLASSWSISADNKTYTFNLRRDVQFHKTPWFEPTRPLTAEDVIFSFGRQIDEAHPWYGQNEAAKYGPMVSLRSQVNSIEAPDNRTVIFKLKQPYAPFLSDLAMGVSSIISAEYANQLERSGTRNELATNPVGTGPFTYLDYQKDVAVRYQAFEDYWDGKAKTKNFIIAITPDQTVRAQKVIAGECHVSPYPSPTQVESLEATPGIHVETVDGLNFSYMAFNTKKEPFNDVRVRKAISIAIDRNAILAAVYYSQARLAATPIPPNLWGFNAALKVPEHDLDGARELLKSVGVSKLKLKLWSMPVQRDYNPNSKVMSELIAADLSAIGIDTEIVTYEWGEYLNRSKDVDRDGAVLLGFIADTVDPDNFISTLFSCRNVGGTNLSNWCNHEVDEMITKAATSSDRIEREQLYKTVQSKIALEFPMIPFAYAAFSVVVSDRVRGYVIEPMGWHRFNNVSLE